MELKSASKKYVKLIIEALILLIIELHLIQAFYLSKP